jgi:hypothetical protein
MKDQMLGVVVEGLRELESIAASNFTDKKLRIKSKMIAILGEAFNVDATFWAVEKGKLKREIFFNRRMTDAELDSAFESLPSIPINSNSIVGYFSLSSLSKSTQSLDIPENVRPYQIKPSIEVWGFNSYEDLPSKIVKRAKDFSKKFNYSFGSMYLICYRPSQDDHPVYVIHFIKPVGLEFNLEEKSIIEIFFRHLIQLVKNIDSSEKKGKQQEAKAEPVAVNLEANEDLLSFRQEVRQGLRELDRRLSKDHALQLDIEERLERLEVQVGKLGAG